MLIRPERPGEEDAIHELTQTAFAPMPYSADTEGPIIQALRRSGDLALSLVAEDDGVIIGHIAFSPVTVEGTLGGWFGLGPISVQPERQRQGIGKALIRDGLERLKAQGAKGCALIGNPDVYRSSGFENDGQLSYDGVDSRYVQWVSFSGAAPRGVLKFSSAFDVKA
ncbi:GNAT family N-acetyltransferase [Rhizobium terrae]|uniref:GNAT family N-acetyltransferase n=1 Tax=Rhizobium terrae TaxID=2171756 RepID=UPI000E3BEC5B|nr:N-acetyltransferase [Rhizobium terrae]